ncbi:MAG: 8-amino-7-oxononanoate synthase [Thermodesulfobacteriota bacterium]|nr:8-amino-7-oxononanoate synthase [Thermodesulfobacteriota bacterium]
MSEDERALVWYYMKTSFFQPLEEKLLDLKRQDRLRSLPPVELFGDVRAEIGGKDVMLFCSNSYLGLSSDPRLREAVRRSLVRYPVGSGAARLISGNTSLHANLERKCAELKGCEAAVLFSTGYMANIGIISSMAGHGDVIFSDAFNHASVVDGCRMSMAETEIFRHRDYAHLEGLLEAKAPRNGGKAVIITDSVFSMDGDVADMHKICELAARYGALVVMDDAHGTGVLGPTGGGLAEEQNCEEKIDVFVGTLGKALGCFGAFVAGKKLVIDWIVNKARTFIYTTSLPVSVVAAADAAVDISISEEWRRERLRSLSRLVFEEISALGKGVVNQTRDGSSLRPFTPIIPLIVGEDRAAVELSQRLLQEGLWVQAARPPTVAEHTSRLRITLSAAHTNADAEKLLNALTKHLTIMGI